MSTSLFNQVLDELSKDGATPEDVRRHINHTGNLFYGEIPPEYVKLTGYKVDIDNLVIDSEVNREYIKELHEKRLKQGN